MTDYNDYTISKFNAVLFVLIFLTAIFLPLAGSVTQTSSIRSFSEKRILASIPETPVSIKTLRRYPEKFDLYYKDNFGFRNDLLWYNKLKYWVGNSPSDKVILGKDGWLFYNGEPFTDLQNTFRGIHRLTDSDLKQYAEALNTRYQWLKNQDIQYLLVIAPNKHTIYREHLPDTMFQVNSETLTDQFFNYIKLHTDVPVLDLRQALLSKKSSEVTLYFKTDTHWNHLGTNIAQYEIAKILSTYFPDQIKPKLYKEKDFKIKTGPGGDLSRLLGLTKKFEDIYHNPILDRCATRAIPKDGNFAKPFTTRCEKSDLKALVFRDSFFEYLYQYISLYFKQATFISKRIEFSALSKYLDNDKPDIVIEEWAERFLIAVPELEPEFNQTD